MMKTLYTLLITLFICAFYLAINPLGVSAAIIDPGNTCNPATDQCTGGYICVPGKPPYNSAFHICQSVFGTITPPAPLGSDPTGARGISKFLSNLIALIFSLSTVVFILMLIWGAFDWLTSEGDKEKIASAQSKIINALIGAILLAIAFAAIQILGQFTGFKFFVGQK